MQFKQFILLCDGTKDKALEIHYGAFFSLFTQPCTTKKEQEIHELQLS